MFLNKLFNINSGEWSRVGVAWLIRFLYRMGFVIGWTIIVAMFVGKYGIYSLPYLFAVNALFTILGSLIYSLFLNRFTKEQIMIGTIFAAGIILSVATIFAVSYEILFFLLLIVAESIFLMQFKMLMDSFTEEMFNPLSSERTFPIIEAAETVGGIIAGLIVFSFAGLIDPFKFVYLWVALLFLMVPLILFSGRHAEPSKIKPRVVGILDRVKKEMKNSKHVSFIRGLILIVFFQWFLFNLIEFQYTKAVYSNISGVVLEGGSGFEHAFVHDLGALFALFSGSALLIQLFVGGRLIRYLGVVGSMILHPLVTLLSLVGLTVRFGFPSAILAKNNFVVTTAIHTNAYHSAYYAIQESFREYTREFLEGFVRPIGALLGTFSLLVLQIFWTDASLVLALNVLMISIALILFAVEYLQQNKYTKLALDDLVKSDDRKVRLNAIDILAQNGHKSSLPRLLNLLIDTDQDAFVRVGILRALSERQDEETINAIVKCLKDKNFEIRDAAIDTLLCYKNFDRSSKRNLFAKYELLEALKNLYKTESRANIQAKIMVLISRFSTVSAVEFLLNVLKHSKGNHKADAIYALGNFADDSICEILEPFLRARNFRQQISAAIALRRFKDFRSEADHLISSFLYSSNHAKVVHGLFAVGELKVKSKKRLCMRFLKSDNIELRMHSAIALAKMKYSESISVIVDLLSGKNSKFAKKTRHLMQNIDVRIYRNIDKLVKQIVS